MQMLFSMLKFIVSFLDRIVIWLIKTVYSLFYDLSGIMLYSENVIKVLGQRIGLILGKIGRAHV